MKKFLWPGKRIRVVYENFFGPQSSSLFSDREEIPYCMLHAFIHSEACETAGDSFKQSCLKQEHLSL